MSDTHRRSIEARAGLTPFDLYYHVISANDTEEGGNIPYFDANPFSQNEWDLKAALHQGDKKSLNVYLMRLTSPLYQAWSTLPLELEFSVQKDGIVLHNSVFLYGSNTNYNLGKTLIHDWASLRWFGLSHIFDGGCEDNFDCVDDTPLEAVPTAGPVGECPIGRDSCPDDPGLDPIHNCMDYTSNECRTEFTAGQIQCMHEQVLQFRNLTPGGLS
ncbi:hypothetical protein D9758_006672 [Tetrapyrgos nigripes]|uniref:Peptidase M43 pregnancy-associated plasma-A domain-containing protein n=1 Tax=Tetrapyrgos nigripes TaxID=182062 RepID=A0A8H5LQN2_9AGAR|nr:hypothetical protein D9758_006672 [Tetrapyrgos nigripes]